MCCVAVTYPLHSVCGVIALQFHKFIWTGYAVSYAKLWQKIIDISAWQKIIDISTPQCAASIDGPIIWYKLQTCLVLIIDSITQDILLGSISELSCCHLCWELSYMITALAAHVIDLPCFHSQTSSIPLRRYAKEYIDVHTCQVNSSPTKTFYHNILQDIFHGCCFKFFYE